jgi:hypothetical protein
MIEFNGNRQADFILRPSSLEQFAGRSRHWSDGHRGLTFGASRLP